MRKLFTWYSTSSQSRRSYQGIAWSIKSHIKVWVTVYGKSLHGERGEGGKRQKVQLGRNHNRKFPGCRQSIQSTPSIKEGTFDSSFSAENFKFCIRGTRRGTEEKCEPKEEANLGSSADSSAYRLGQNEVEKSNHSFVFQDPTPKPSFSQKSVHSESAGSS